MRVLALTKYGDAAASTRQRVLQYMPALVANGIEVDYYPLLGNDYVSSLATGGRFSKVKVAKSYARRFVQLATAGDYDLIWVYAEVFPYLPAPFERLVFRGGTPLIYDFDDAFFHAYDENPRRHLRALLGGKLEPLVRGAAACCCGNDYLREYASRFCANTMLLPTVVDTDVYQPVGRQTDTLTIGWIGSPSTWGFVKPLLPLLQDLCRERGIAVTVVGAGAGAKSDAFQGLSFVDWREDKEVGDVQSMDIGIMPLPDEPWARGKSGYKLIQYMACGLPVVASPVGVNATIVKHGESGYLATSLEEWRSALEALIDDIALRKGMGEAGRDRAVREYSLQSQAPRLIELFKSVAEGR